MFFSIEFFNKFVGRFCFFSAVGIIGAIIARQYAVGGVLFFALRNAVRIAVELPEFETEKLVRF